MNISSISAAASYAQEAVETAAQTKAEAAKGDQQAARKMAASQAQQTQTQSAPEGTGQVLDVKA